MMRKVTITFFLIGVWLRVALLTTPFIEYQANRSIEAAAMVKVFVEKGGNPFTVQSLMPEFQLLPYLVALIYKLCCWLAGGQDNLLTFTSAVFSGDGYYPFIALLARGIVISISLLGMYFLWKLARRLVSPVGARCALLWYALLPVSFFYQRTFMTDAVALSLTTIGLYYFLRATQDDRLAALLPSGICLALAFLCKLNYVYILLPMAYLAVRRWRGRIVTQRWLWVFALGILAPCFWHYFLKGNRVIGYLTANTMPAWTDFLRFLWVRHSLTVFTPVGFVLFLFGIVLAVRQRLWLVLVWLIAVLCNYLLTGYEANRLHFYYQLPILVPGVICIGLACSRVVEWLRSAHRGVKRLSLAALGAFSLVGIAGSAYVNDTHAINWYTMPYIKSMYQSGFKISRLLEPDAEILTSDNGALDTLYYCDRQGWQFMPGTPEYNRAAIEIFRQGSQIPYGRRYEFRAPSHGRAKRYFVAVFENMLMNRRLFRESGLEEYLTLHYPLVGEGLHYCLYDLTQRIDLVPRAVITLAGLSQDTPPLLTHGLSVYDRQGKGFYYSPTHAAQPGYLIYRLKPGVPLRRCFIRVRGYVVGRGALEVFTSWDNRSYTYQGRIPTYEEQGAVYVPGWLLNGILLVKDLWIGNKPDHWLHGVDKDNRQGSAVARLFSLNYYEGTTTFMVEAPAQAGNELFIKVQIQGGKDATKLKGLEVEAL